MSNMRNVTSRAAVAYSSRVHDISPISLWSFYIEYCRLLLFWYAMLLSEFCASCIVVPLMYILHFSWIILTRNGASGFKINELLVFKILHAYFWSQVTLKIQRNISYSNWKSVKLRKCIWVFFFKDNKGFMSLQIKKRAGVKNSNFRDPVLNQNVIL